MAWKQEFDFILGGQIQDTFVGVDHLETLPWTQSHTRTHVCRKGYYTPYWQSAG